MSSPSGTAPTNRERAERGQSSTLLGIWANVALVLALVKSLGQMLIGELVSSLAVLRLSRR